MFLQGDLQNLFDALYRVGAIDPVLKMDWSLVTKEMQSNPEKVQNLYGLVNSHRGSTDQLAGQLRKLDSQSLSFIAVEVARELAEFQDRKTIH
jgi:hypothetical protein